MNKLQIKGFTILELMIVVVIVGVLAAIAIPAYSDYVTRSKRADAKAGLLSLQLEQEKYRANNPSYATGANLAAQLGVALPFISPDGIYTVVVQDASVGASTYAITATPIAGEQNDPLCNALTIDQDGFNSSSGTIAAADAEATCWQR